MIDTGRYYRGFLGLAVAATGALLLTGCGSSNDAGETASGPLTKAAFVRQANAICQKAESKKFKELNTAAKARGGAFGSSQEIAEVIGKVILPSYGEILAEMEGLRPPKRDKAQVEKILRGYRATVKAGEAKPGRLIVSDPFAAPNRTAARYGIECTF